MTTEATNLMYQLKYLFFPMLFQGDFLSFAWGAGNPMWMTVCKRLFLLLPVLAIILGCWVSLFSVASVVIREQRRNYLNAIMVTWWDLGRSIFNFWGGIFRAGFYLVGSLFALMRFIVQGFWMVLQDLILIPFRIIKNSTARFLAPGIPWIAVTLTLVWCALEAVIFTYVMTPLVIDTFSNLTGSNLAEHVIRVPLFMFMLFLILGSYAVLSSLADAVQSKQISAIVKIAMIEVVALFVEVVFLYREFVDSLVPWFAQHASDGFSLGIFGTLAISTCAWLGIRGLSWFLFAAHGTPTIMAVIKGAGVHQSSLGTSTPAHPFESTLGYTHTLKQELSWIQQKGDELVGAFLLPPLQIVAACINFSTLLITCEHLFALPFRSMDDVLDTKELMPGLAKLASSSAKANSAPKNVRQSVIPRRAVAPGQTGDFVIPREAL